MHVHSACQITVNIEQTWFIMVLFIATITLGNCQGKVGACLTTSDDLTFVVHLVKFWYALKM